jgi:prepilin-type N-terminal cleavage/methylation domain-containing protein
MTLSSFNLEASPVARMRKAGRRGFTLAEVMMAVTMFTWLSLGVFMMLSKAYELSKITRCMDDGRAALATFGDQFLRLQTTDTEPSTQPDGTIVNGTWTRWLFKPSGTGTDGTGLNWGSMSDTHGSVAAPSVSSLNVNIGGASLNVPAQITRQVQYVDPTTGATTTSKLVATSGGYMLQATFTITYTISGRLHTQKLVVMRYVP